MSRARAFVAAAVTTASLTVPLVVGIAPALAETGIGLSQGTDLIAVQPAGSLPGYLVAADADASTASVVVTDALGTNPVTVPIPNANALALGPDGRTVWAASGAGAVFSFPVDNPTALQTYPPADSACLSDVAVSSSDVVYVVEGCEDSPTYSLHTLDLGDGAQDPTLSEPITNDNLPASSSAPLLLDNALANPDRLIVVAQYTSIDLLDVSGATPSELAFVPSVHAYTVAVAPDAKSMLVSLSGLPGDAYFGARRYTVGTSPHVVGGIFASTDWPMYGLAFDPTGAYAAASEYGAFQSFGPSSNLTLRVYRPTDGVSPSRGVAWLGQSLFTLVTDYGTGQVYLRRHTDAVIAPTTITLTRSTSPTVGKTLHLTGAVSDRGTHLGTVPLTVTRTDREGTTTYSSYTDSSGNYNFANVPRDGQTNTYKVSYAGDALHGAVSKSISFTVIRKATFLSIATDHGDYYYNQLATITAHLGGTYNGRNVAIYAQPVGQSKKRIGYGHVDSSGHFHATFRPQRNTVYSATFFGDLRYAPVTKTLLRKTHANVLGELQNYYGTDSDGYRLYHKTKDAKFHAHIDPNKGGQCVHFVLQQLVSGKWKTLAYSDCFYLNSYSNSDVYWWLKNFADIGGHYRTGVYWGGDSVNEGTGSLWRYFKVTT